MGSIFMLLLLGLVGFSGGQFIEEPQSYIAYLGQPDVPFNCIVNTTEAGYIRWNVNGNCEGSPNCFTTVDQIKNCTYTIDAEVNANGTQIQCLAMCGNDPTCDDPNCTESSIVNRSNIALLLIQGPLAAPGNVRGAGDNVIEWDAPFSLDITAAPDITNYRVYEWRSGDLTVVADNVPGNAANFNFTDYNRACNRSSNFLVTAFNPVGEGNMSEEVKGASVCSGTTFKPGIIMLLLMTAVASSVNTELFC